jgi:hypothetical protein
VYSSRSTELYELAIELFDMHLRSTAVFAISLLQTTIEAADVNLKASLIISIMFRHATFEIRSYTCIPF